jgi:hypothetical protein
MQCVGGRQDFILMAGWDVSPWHGKLMEELGEGKALHFITEQDTRI